MGGQTDALTPLILSVTCTMMVHHVTTTDVRNFKKIKKKSGDILKFD